MLFYLKETLLQQKRNTFSKRSELLKQYIIDWDEYSKKEKEQEQQKQDFTREEVEFIDQSRKEPDSLLLSLKKSNNS